MLGCDRFYSVRGDIYNYSNDTLILKTTLKDSISTKYLAPGESADFHEAFHSRKIDCCPCEFSFIEVFPKDPAKKLNKAFTNKENWEFFSPKKSNDNGSSCIFKITFADVQ